MKSVSVNDLSSYLDQGWKIDARDMNAVSERLKFNQSAVEIIKSLEGIRETIIAAVKMLPAQDTGWIKPLLVKQHNEILQLIQGLEKDEPKTWEFDIKRGNNGFIDKVIANGR